MKINFSDTVIEFTKKPDYLIGLIACGNSNGTCLSHVPNGHVLVTISKIKISTERKCCPGYHETEDKKCHPFCKVHCINSICSGPDTCQCNPGYKPTNDSHRHIRTLPILLTLNDLMRDLYRCAPILCSEGFKFSQDSKECDPICFAPCTDGVCLKPGECECNSGFHKNDSGTCTRNECDPVAAVSNECHNGTCSNGTCLCNNGFIKNPSTLNCYPGTESQNVSNCSDGFEWNNSEWKCVKVTGYCHVCQCVNTVFSSKSLTVNKACYTYVLIVALLVVMVCAVSVFLYRRYIKRINHPYNLSI